MLIKVRANAGARNERIEKVSDRYEISVREQAAGGIANSRVLELLARELGTPIKRLRIIKGQRSPSKTIEVL